MHPIMINASKFVGYTVIGTVGGLLMAVGMDYVEMKYLKRKNRKKEVES